jgi:hypothetical protein
MRIHMDWVTLLSIGKEATGSNYLLLPILLKRD